MIAATARNGAEIPLQRWEQARAEARVLHLFVIGLLCFNSKASVAKKKFRNVHHKVAIAFGCSEKTIHVGLRRRGRGGPTPPHHFDR